MDSNLKKAYFLGFVFSLLYFVVFFFFALWFKDIGLSGFEIGLVFAVFNFTTLVLLFPIGLVNDRLTIRLTTTVGFLAMALALFFLSSASSFEAIALLFFILGSGHALSTNSIVNFFFKTATGKEGEKYGSFHALRAMGLVIGSVIGGASLFFLVDFRVLLFIMSIAYTLLAVIAFSMKDTPVFTFSVGKYVKDFFRKEVLIFVLILFLWTTHWGAETTSYTLFLRENLGLNTLEIGLYMAASIFFLGAAAFLAGKQVDKGLDFKKVFFFGILLSGIGHIAMTYAFVPSSLLFRMIHEFGDGLAIFGFYFWTSKLFHIKRIGGNAMLVLTVTVLGDITGAILFGFLGEAIGYEWPLIISGVIGLLIALIFFFVKKWY